MPCYRPLTGYRSRDVNPSGKRNIVFTVSQAFNDLPVTVPCGQCIGCRLERSRQWALRCVHEASLWKDNCFITLTYNDAHLPPDKTLVMTDFQKFMKRLRKRFGSGVRYFMCGEYGEKLFRPHYHACLFNFDFKDKQLWKTVRGNRLYTSDSLCELWSDSKTGSIGFSTIGEVTFESAAYVARYITKKITGEKALYHYNVVDFATGEILSERKPEYTCMSRRPGIGRGWFERFHSEVYPSDEVIVDRGGKMLKMKPPRYYDKIFDQYDPSEFRKVKNSRVVVAKGNDWNNTADRLRVRETVQTIKKDLFLGRNLENDI